VDLIVYNHFRNYKRQQANDKGLQFENFTGGHPEFFFGGADLQAIYNLYVILKITL
jgi:hypothetical protein